MRTKIKHYSEGELKIHRYHCNVCDRDNYAYFTPEEKVFDCLLCKQGRLHYLGIVEEGSIMTLAKEH